MKSKSFELHRKSAENVKQNKTYDFVNFYKPASETNVKFVEKRKSDDGSIKENDTHATNAQISSRERSPYKKKKKVKSDTSLNISQINVEDISLPHASEMLNNSKVTSTPNNNVKKNKNVKSIMKNSSLDKKSPNASTITVINSKPKKRNKSVSFMLEETDEVVIKKSKSSDSFKNSRTSEEKIHKKKSKSNNLKSENDTDTGNAKNKTKETQEDQSNDTSSLNQDKEKKKHKKLKKPKPTKTEQKVTEAEQEADSINNNVSDRKIKKAKSRRPKSKSVDTEIINEKTNVKQEIKPEIIAQDLQNLNIGDNPHTLTNLLDEMTVVDKNKRKKNKKSFRKEHPKEVSSSIETEAADTETKEEKEKVKWIKRKWNKDKKGLIHDTNLSTYIIVENLPLKIMCSYKKVLMEHFTKFGLVKQVGIAELYSMEDPEVFTTTICFESEDAVKKALEEDNTLFEGNRIRIKRQMPPTQTTLVVRCFANITDSALSSMFAGAGRIRNVKQVIKGKKSMCTAFIEFDGPDAVERAIKLAEGVKVERKKIFASRYEVRNNHKKFKTESKDDDASDASED